MTETDNNVGGMFNILNICLKIAKKGCTIEFDTKDVAEFTGICEQSVRNNLTRLVNSGYLIRHEHFSCIGKKKRIVKYSINKEILSVLESIMDGD